MSRFITSHIGKPLFLVAIFILVVTFASGTVLAASYFIDREVPASVIINPPSTTTTTTTTVVPPPPTPVSATLYLDSSCTSPLLSSASLTFPTVTQGSGLASQLSLWFKYSDILPSSVSVSAVGLPSGYQVGYSCTPNVSTGACELLMTLPETLPSGSYSFSLHITGNS